MNRLQTKIEKTKNALNTMQAKASMLAFAGSTAVTNAMNELVPQAGSIKGAALSIADALINVFPAIGIFLVLFGGFKLLMALRNDQPEAVKGAATDLAIGVALLIFKTLLWEPLKAAINGVN